MSLPCYVGCWQRWTELERATVEEVDGLCCHYYNLVLVDGIDCENGFSLKLKLPAFPSSQKQCIVLPLQQNVFGVLDIEISLPDRRQQLSFCSQQDLFSANSAILPCNFCHRQFAPNYCSDTVFFC